MAVPIHVLHLINSLGMGGAEKRLTEIIESLSSDEFRFTVMCLSHAGAYESRVRAAGGEVEVLHYRGLRRDGRIAIRNLFEPLIAMRKFQQALDRHRPDVVQTWLPISNFVGGRAMCRWRYRHMTLIASRVFTGEYREANPLIPLAEMMATRRADLVYCNSNAVRDDTISTEITIDPSNIRVIRNGVDTEKFRPCEDRLRARRELGLSADERLILSVGALRKHKGHSVLLDAAKQILAELEAVRFLLVGEDQGEGPALRRQADELGIADQVEFVGARDDVALWMQAADAFVLPSLQEGLPNALLEAMASGLPCVATQLPGCMEILEYGKHGLLVPPEQPEALSDALSTLLNQTDLQTRLGKDAQHHIRDHFSFTRMMEEFAELYREAANRFP